MSPLVLSFGFERFYLVLNDIFSVNFFPLTFLNLRRFTLVTGRVVNCLDVVAIGRRGASVRGETGVCSSA